jgi:cytochrome P460
MRSLVLILTMSFALTGCQSTRPEPASINQQASLTSKLPYNPLGWRVVSSWTNERQATMSTLYGNDLAIQNLRASSASPYPPGSVLALVTWSQREDPHWFGARIPSTPQSVEFVSISLRQSPSYQKYEGAQLKLVNNTDGGATAKRIDYLVSQRAAVMP